MAGPINGLNAGVQQQVLQQSQLQSGQNENQVRQQNDRQRPEENRVQPQSAATAETFEASTDNNRAPALEQNNLGQESVLEQAEQRRGSLVDISV